MNNLLNYSKNVAVYVLSSNLLEIDTVSVNISVTVKTINFTLRDSFVLIKCELF